MWELDLKGVSYVQVINQIQNNHMTIIRSSGTFGGGFDTQSKHNLRTGTFGRHSHVLADFRRCSGKGTMVTAICTESLCVRAGRHFRMECRACHPLESPAAVGDAGKQDEPSGPSNALSLICSC